MSEMHGVPTPGDRPGGPRLLLLSPSTGLGGGIERVMDAVQAGWQGPIERIDLLRGDTPGAEVQRSADGRVNRSAIVTFALRALRSAGRHRPDVVLCGLLGLLPIAVPIARIFRRRLALFAYGIDVWGSIGSAERVLISRCSHLLTISTYTASKFAARAQISPERMRILALPIAVSIAAAARTPGDDHGERPPVVLTVSRLARTDRYKGHFEIARCFGRVLARRPDARWIVVGDGDDLPALRSECHRVGITDAVTFTGSISDVDLVALYRTAAIFALPSFADADAVPPVGEGFGLVYAEAGAFELPIIAARQGGGSMDYVIDGRTGLTVGNDSPDELADAIVRLLEDAELRGELGRQARARTFARHLPEHFRDALAESLR